MLDSAVLDILGGGCALIVGVIDATGEAHATRGWGLEVLETGCHDPAPVSPRIRLLLDAVVDRHLLEIGQRIAVTSADVRTLRSLQLKGIATSIEEATEADEELADRYADRFIGEISETDGTDPALLEPWIPTTYLACTVEIDALFDQTPGPAAGSSLTGTAR